jgi:DNA-binding NarL/FixJ family response regulator
MWSIGSGGPLWGSSGSRGGNLATSVRVLLVDDYEPFRRAIASRLQEQPELLVIAEASDGFEAVEKAKELQPDLILLDIGLPKQNGIEAARQIQEVSPISKILFVSECRSADIAEAAVNTVGGGYVVKPDITRDLLVAVDAVVKGERFLSARLRGDINLPLHTGTSESDDKTNNDFAMDF